MLYCGRRTTPSVPSSYWLAYSSFPTELVFHVSHSLLQSLPNAALRGLRAYDPGHDLPVLRRQIGESVVELGSNENTLGPSPAVLAALTKVDAQTLLRYPDPRGYALRQALAEQESVSADNVLLGNGSHEILMMIAQAFAQSGDDIVFSEFGFAVFAIACAAAGANAIRVPALPIHDAQARGHDLPALARAISTKTKIVFLANPNNPTGTCFSDGELDAFIAQVPENVLVVVDEAYFEYARTPTWTSARRLISNFPNVLLTRTFSKAYALAGLRIGYAIGDAGVIGLLDRLRESFNVNALALIAAQAALTDLEHMRKAVDIVAAARERVREMATDMGIFAHPSQTNFVLLDFAKDASLIEEKLMQQGVIVRPMRGYGLPACLRVSVASAAENQRFLDALEKAL
jgi:histidinol-phosphate aminotransferase